MRMYDKIGTDWVRNQILTRLDVRVDGIYNGTQITMWTDSQRCLIATCRVTGIPAHSSSLAPWQDDYDDVLTEREEYIKCIPERNDWSIVLLGMDESHRFLYELDLPREQANGWILPLDIEFWPILWLESKVELKLFFKTAEKMNIDVMSTLLERFPDLQKDLYFGELRLDFAQWRDSEKSEFIWEPSEPTV